MSEPALCDAPRPVRAKPHSALPEGACDCHFHIFDAPSIQVPERSYSAPLASLAEYRHLQKQLGIQRSVIVQPSIYGTDNRTTMSVCQSDPHCKAVVVIDEHVSDTQLAAYAKGGAVGCRVNLLFASGVNHGSLRSLAKRIAAFDWHLQILADISQFDGLSSLIPQMPVPVILDHMGHMPATLGVEHKAFQRFLKYFSDGKIWVKLSAAYRLSAQSDGAYDDVGNFVTALVDANNEHLVWGTDWPHPQAPGAMPDETDLLNQFLDWVPNQQDRQRIFVDNPVSFYQFERSL